jgi:hypothetical protein
MLKSIVLAVMLFFLLSPSNVSACTCAFIETAQEELALQDVVFVGQVMAIVEPEPGQLQTTFKIEKIYKGLPVGTTTIEVYSLSAGKSCGIVFDLNEKYLIFGANSSEKLYTSSCTRSKKLSAAAGDLKELEQPRAPTKEISNKKKNRQRHLVFWGKREDGR